LSEARVRTPRPVPLHREVRSAPLSPTDGYVLSRVDGTLNERDLTESTGLKEEHVQASLAKLEALGFIVYDGIPPSPSVVLTSTPASPPLPASGPAPAGATEAAAMAEAVDLGDELRQRVIDTHRNIDRLDHYKLLGVDRSADRKAIKRAYYDLAAQFHPDRYFRKNLGSFKGRMEVIFERITAAHDALTGKEERAEYDAYLEEQRRSRGIEELLADAMAEVKRAEESVERAVRSQEHAVAARAIAPPAPTAAAPSVDAATRRDALARRLLGGRGAGASSAPPTQPSRAPSASSVSNASSASSASSAMESLRRRYEDRMAQAKAVEARKYVTRAEEALAAGDAVSAANALRVASGLAPQDPELQRRAAEAKAKADEVLSETYARQARYEEKSNHFVEAARSWARVCKARPDDSLAHERAANAMVKAGGDLHEAARLGKRACELDPRSARARVTLAEVYLAAGLFLNAQRELETAAQLAPHDDNIQAMMKRVGKLA
jgi:curved DNA-binding protein CbpA